MSALATLLETPLELGTKGLPCGSAGVLLKDVAGQQWNLLQEHIPLPAAIILRSALEHNAAWMRDFLKEENVSIAPHGKTTMAPQLFDLQLASGAWGITVATVQQLKVCRRFGIQRVLMANQLVVADDIRYVAKELSRDSSFEFYCIIDSIEGVERLQRIVRQTEAGAVVRVLLEVGVKGGRCGCRTVDSALQVAEYTAAQPNLQLHGVECYEGIIAGNAPHQDALQIKELLARLLATYRACKSLNLFFKPGQVLLSAGGSAWFDIVAPMLSQSGETSVKAVLRSGCYLTHDNVFYERHFQNMQARWAGKKRVMGRLLPALEVWACVQSIPEPGLAILSLGKRDISHDIDLPVVTKWFRPGQMQAPATVNSEWVLFALNDQHAYSNFPDGMDLAVGDMVALGISHPCTTFDKWRLLWLVDDDYNIVDGIRTFF